MSANHATSYCPGERLHLSRNALRAEDTEGCVMPGFYAEPAISLSYKQVSRDEKEQFADRHKLLPVAPPGSQTRVKGER